MILVKFLGSYCRETSIHGLRYIAEGSSAVERTIWTTTIAIAFSLAGLMITSNINDLKENPISTAIDTISVLGLPFPALSMKAAVLNHPYRLIESVYNNVHFDCSNLDYGGSCDETSNIREDIQGDLKALLLYQYDTFFRQCSIGNSQAISKPNWLIEQKSLMSQLCSSDDGFHGSEVLRMLYPCINVGDDFLSDFQERLLNTMEALAVTFRMHHSFIANFSTTFKNACPHEISRNEWNCSEAIQNFPDVQICHSIALFYITVSPYNLEFQPGVVLKSLREKKFKTNRNHGLSLLESQAKVEEEKFADLCLLNSFLSGKDFAPCVGGVDIGYLLANMNLVYKTYKQIIAPSSMVANEKSEMIQANAIGGKLFSDYNYQVKNVTICDSEATFLACKFGENGMSTICDLFSNMFMYSGLGYTFNNEPYWTLIKNTPSNQAFFSEFYEKNIDDYDSNLPRTIKNTGKEYSLDFVIRHSPYGYDRPEQSGYPENYPEILMTLHDPSELPNENSGGIAVMPGMLYDIKVYPIVTVTDESGLSLGPRARNCHTREENENLVAFKSYSQSACLFECRLREAIKTCRCSPVEYPRIEPLAGICLDVASKKCFVDVMDVVALDYDCDCPNDCNNIRYHVDVHATKLQLSNSKEDLVNFTRKFDKLQHLDGVIEIPVGYDEATVKLDTLSRVVVSVQTETATKVIRSARWAFSDYLANLGGIIGLFTGISILTLAESVFMIVKFLKQVM